MSTKAPRIAKRKQQTTRDHLNHRQLDGEGGEIERLKLFIQAGLLSVDEIRAESNNLNIPPWTNVFRFHLPDTTIIKQFSESSFGENPNARLRDSDRMGDQEVLRDEAIDVFVPPPRLLDGFAAMGYRDGATSFSAILHLSLPNHPRCIDQRSKTARRKNQLKITLKRKEEELEMAYEPEINIARARQLRGERVRCLQAEIEQLELMVEESYKAECELVGNLYKHRRQNYVYSGVDKWMEFFNMTTFIEPPPSAFSSICVCGNQTLLEQYWHGKITESDRRFIVVEGSTCTLKYERCLTDGCDSKIRTNLTSSELEKMRKVSDGKVEEEISTANEMARDLKRKFCSSCRKSMCGDPTCIEGITSQYKMCPAHSDDCDQCGEPLPKRRTRFCSDACSLKRWY